MQTTKYLLCGFVVLQVNKNLHTDKNPENVQQKKKNLLTESNGLGSLGYCLRWQGKWFAIIPKI